MADDVTASPQLDGTEPGTKIEKFKSADDRDKAYLELEKQNSEQARRLAEVEARLDVYGSMVTQPAPQAQDNRSFTDLYPARQTDDDREAALAAKLLTKPSQVLAEYGHRVREETLREVRAHMANEQLVNRFRIEHPDLAKHEEVVAMFVRKQPENLSSDQRLRLAVPEARRYLTSLAGPPVTTNLDPAAYVEAPTQRPGAVGAAAATEPSDEDDLTQMIRERSTLQQKRMRV